MQRPLFRSELTQTVEWQVDTFSDADSGKASQQEGIGIQVVFAAQFVLEPMIIFRGQRSGEIFRERAEDLRGIMRPGWRWWP